MNLKKILSKDSIMMDVHANSKNEILAELTDYLVGEGKISDRDKVFEALIDRESKMSTGMGQGVAIPHAKTDCVNEMVALIAIKKSGAEFNSMDGQPSNIFILTLSPATKSGPHIQFLADISRVLAKEETRKQILACSTKQQVLDIFVNY